MVQKWNISIYCCFVECRGFCSHLCYTKIYIWKSHSAISGRDFKTNGTHTYSFNDNTEHRIKLLNSEHFIKINYYLVHPCEVGGYYTCIYMRTPKHKWIKQLIQEPRDRLIVEICMHTCIHVCLNGFGPSRAFPAHRGQAALLGSSRHRVPGTSNERYQSKEREEIFLWFARIGIKASFQTAKEQKTHC